MSTSGATTHQQYGCGLCRPFAPPVLTDGSSEGMSRLPSVSGLSRNPHHNMGFGDNNRTLVLAVSRVKCRGGTVHRREHGERREKDRIREGEGRITAENAEKRMELGYAICSESFYRKFYIDYWL